jgi:hypothetical protein
MKRVIGVGGIFESLATNRHESVKMKTDHYSRVTSHFEKLGGEGFEPPTLSV